MHREIGLLNKKGGVKLFLIAIALFVVVAAAISLAARTDLTVRTDFAARTENPTIINAYVEPTKVVPEDDFIAVNGGFL